MLSDRGRLEVNRPAVLGGLLAGGRQDAGHNAGQDQYGEAVHAHGYSRIRCLRFITSRYGTTPKILSFSSVIGSARKPYRRNMSAARFIGSPGLRLMMLSTMRSLSTALSSAMNRSRISSTPKSLSASSTT